MFDRKGLFFRRHKQQWAEMARNQERKRGNDQFERKKDNESWQFDY